MAATKIWNVCGRIDRVIDYAANPEKTKYSEADLQSLRDVMDYAMNDFKTEEQYYVSGINCDVEVARQNMTDTKIRFNKLDGNMAYHAYQSFAPGEVTPDMAHEIGIKLAEQMWGDRFEVIVATHLNSHCIHKHFCQG